MHSRTTVLFLLLFVATVARGAEKTGPLTGTITGRDTTSNQLTVNHQNVPGIMAAMQMAYEVRGQKVSALPKDGSAITATLHESGGEYWLTDVALSADHSSHAMHSENSSMTMKHDATSNLLMRQVSGTAMNPAAAPMPMKMVQAGDWMVMLHGLAFVDQVIQSGPRGGDKLFSSNWVMGMADRPLAGGHLMLRSMLSLEPLTIGKGYPHLFQTGETDDGRPIVDAQHPHDFFMEIAAEYARPLADDTIGYVYAAPFGDPSLGPVAFPHRASAAEIPQATLSHHVQDSTHIAGSVVTMGVQRGMFGYSLSGFHGREPDENRWDIDTGKIDSWAARFTFDPTPNITAQVSTGHLVSPEALEPGNVQRTTASVSYSDATFDASLIFGRNDFSRAHTGGTNSLVAEGVFKFGGVNYLSGRAEVVDKNEIVEDATYRVKALTIGYTRDVVRLQSVDAAIGANATVYSIPRGLESLYGNPRALNVFLRFRSRS